MKLIKTSSMSEHSRNCVPTALAVLIGKPYNEVNEWLKYRGYRASDNRGTVLGGLREMGLSRIPSQPMSVNQFSLHNPIGEYLVHVRNHVVAVKNGIVYDTGNSEKKRVIEVWKKNNESIPYDWDRAQSIVKQAQEHRAQLMKQREREEKIKQRARKIKLQPKPKKTDQDKINALLKRQKQWQSKLKRCQTSLKTITRKLKYYQRKTQQTSI